MALLESFFSRPWLVLTAASTLRLALLLYGRWQDAHSPLKYTDIDYIVFTDAARFVSLNQSPYDRATYRYTPLVAWLLYPSAWGGIWFEWGKLVFAAGDIVTGWLIYLILRENRQMGTARATKFASIWLLNPMVANISTRGSSEGILAVLVVALLWATLRGRVVLAGCLLGFGVHLKIYPFIYAASVFWWLEDSTTAAAKSKTASEERQRSLVTRVRSLITPARLKLATWSFAVFTILNVAMYSIYGKPFIEHSYTYHLTRVDHRHNFSVYNTLLHLNSARSIDAGLRVESLAFVPQLLLSVVIIPLLTARKDLASTMLVQTFAFVAFNKVCTSQYFLWYMVFLPFYLPSSSMLERPRLGLSALLVWVLGQALWLWQGYGLEFLGLSTFVPDLWAASIFFFGANCWIIGIILRDIGSREKPGFSARRIQRG